MSGALHRLVFKCKNQVECRDGTVPENVDTKRRREAGMRAHMQPSP